MNRATYSLEQSAEQAGALMAHDLLNELLQLKDKPQAFALRALQDKIYALSKVQPIDSSAGGFAEGLVNVLQIGVANLPEMDDCEAMPSTVYERPESAAIVLHADDRYLACQNDLQGDPSDCILVNIGPDELIALGLALIEAGHAINGMESK